MDWFKRKLAAGAEFAHSARMRQAESGRLLRWMRYAGVALLVFLPLWYLVGGLIYQRIHDDPGFHANPALVQEGESRAVAAAAAMVDREIDWWAPNAQFWSPAITLDNMPNYQLGLVGAVSRFAIEMVDQLGRQRGSSASDPDLERAAGFLRYDGRTWIMDGWRVTASAEAQYARAVEALRTYNNRLGRGEAVYDIRADNLIALLERIASDLGSASAALDRRTLESDAGWFDFGADETFYNVKGKLYAYFIILRAVGDDYGSVLGDKQLTDIYQRMLENMERAAVMDPLIVSNGAQDALLMPSHLSALGFYLLRARVQLREVTDALAK